MLREAVRFIGGTAALIGGGWVLRAVQGTPAALGASPVDIDAVARRSPHYRDGVFVNMEPASEASLTRHEQFLLARDVIGGGSAQHPATPVPLVTPGSQRGRGRSRRHLVWPLLGDDRGRRVPDPGRSRLE